MSLLTDSYEPFVMLDKQSVSDGMGGIKRTWVEGAQFDANANLDTSMQARIGAVQGVTGLYTITTTRAVSLQPLEVCKRLRDGKIFRVKSDGDDKATPASATLDMRQVSAEEYRLTE